MSFEESETVDSPLYKLGKGLYDTGLLLLHDDKMDIGYGAYFNRPHYYNNELVKDHPSVWHHWPLGVAMMFGGEMLGVLDTLLEMKRAMQAEAEESFNTDIK